jgi:hypothetical protein
MAPSKVVGKMDWDGEHPPSASFEALHISGVGREFYSAIPASDENFHPSSGLNELVKFCCTS